MGLIIDTSLHAASRLSGMGYNIFSPGSAAPDVRIALVNLMPIKTDSEYDFMQLIAPSRRLVKVDLIKMATHHSRHASQEHMDRYYTTFDKVSKKIDGIIVTGAPLDHVTFEDVDYWEEMTDIFITIRERNIPAYYVCWGAFAAVYFWHGIKMRPIERKISGVFKHNIYNANCKLMNKIQNGFSVPHSRYVVWPETELAENAELEIIAGGNDQGPYIVSSKINPEYYVIGHGEYAVDTLDKEYRRDLSKGINPHIPTDYYPFDDPTLTPSDTWHDTAVTIMSNWIEEIIEHKNRQK